MRRTTPLIAAPLLGLALLAPTTATATATSAAETCRGEAATIVGGRGTDVIGTEGRDVVVTNRSSFVKTLGGDDLVCITGPDAARGTEYGVQVDTGPGDDVVDGTAADSWGADVTLGEGRDRFEGGAADDYVSGGHYSVDGSDVRHVDAESDILVGRGGDDLLTSGQAGLPNPDVLLGGAGADGLDPLGTVTATSVLDGGPGRDDVGFVLTAGAHVLDNVAGELRRDGTTVSRWASVESFHLGDPAAGTADIEIIGSDADESFSLSGASRVTAVLGAGDDALSVPAVLPAGSSLTGGEGRDGFSFGTTELGVVWDLSGDAVHLDDGRTIPATGFEDAFVSAPRARLTGTDGPNRLTVNTCDGVLDGRDGADALDLTSDLVFEVFRSCVGEMVLRGGRGHDLMGTRAGSVDRMVGGRGNDRFVAVGGDDRLFGGPGHDRARMGRGRDAFHGGPGKDRVDGEQDRDLCRAERKVSCER